ncbi:MAG: LLM class F420-dependent oxidoreductase [Myxococcales bacterium]|nr:LLM class F420-dependent oxidoreductase [Myxococcales bacterium]
MSFNTETMIRADELAREVEARGFESLWFPEHTHIPASRETPFPGGGPLPDRYAHMSDPFVSISAAAAVTERLLFGTGICLVIQHDPIVLAKTVATVDRLSDGRFLFGVGAGWNVEEMGNHGTRFEDRWRVLRERVEAMKALWSEEEASYHGEFVNFDRVWSYPKPIQDPHPPIILGTFGSRFGRQRVADFGDGWIPVGGFHRGQIGEHVEDLRERLRKNGRPPDAVRISMFDVTETPEDVLLRYRDLGCFERAITAIPVADRETVLPVLDRYAQLIHKLA